MPQEDCSDQFCCHCWKLNRATIVPVSSPHSLLVFIICVDIVSQEEGDRVDGVVASPPWLCLCYLTGHVLHVARDMEGREHGGHITVHRGEESCKASRPLS